MKRFLPRLVTVFSCVFSLLTPLHAQEKTKQYDLIIVGGGALGLSSAYYAAKKGQSILVLEQDKFFNEASGSSSFARQFRVQYNDPRVSRLAIAAIPMWKDLQKQAGEKLLVQSGILWFGDLNTTNAEGKLETAEEDLVKMKLPFETLSSKQIEKRFQFSTLPDTWSGLWQPDGGQINVKGTLHAFYNGAAGNTDFQENQKVVQIASTKSGVVVKTKKDTFYGKKIIIAPGPNINQVLESLNMQLDIEIWEMLLVYYKMKTKKVNYPVWLAFQEGSPNDPNLYYGFPEDIWQYPGYVQVGSNYPSRIYKSLEEYKQRPDPKTIAHISRWVKNHMTDLDPEPKYPATCVVALFVDPSKKSSIRHEKGIGLSHEMLLDFAPSFVPNNRNIVICATGCAFKLLPILGKICVDLAVDGATKYDISCFEFNEDMLKK